jgi:hypothetical protein
MLKSSAFTTDNVRPFDCTWSLTEQSIIPLHIMRAKVGAMPHSNLFCSPPTFQSQVLDVQEDEPLLFLEKLSMNTNSIPTTKRKRQQDVRLTNGTNATKSERSLKAVKRIQLLPKKRVRFQAFPTVHTALVHLDVDVDDDDNTWLTRRELSDIKRAAKESCVAIDIEHELHTTYTEACSFCTQACEDVRTTTGGCCTHPALSYKLLAESKDFSRQRGLERWSSLAHYHARMVQLLVCKTDFFIEQSAQFLQGKRDEDKLADICRNSSKAASQFALVLGQADVVAAADTQDEVTLF